MEMRKEADKKPKRGGHETERIPNGAEAQRSRREKEKAPSTGTWPLRRREVSKGETEGRKMTEYGAEEDIRQEV